MLPSLLAYPNWFVKLNNYKHIIGAFFVTFYKLCNRKPDENYAAIQIPIADVANIIFNSPKNQSPWATVFYICTMLILQHLGKKIVNKIFDEGDANFR